MSTPQEAKAFAEFLNSIEAKVQQGYENQTRWALPHVHLNKLLEHGHDDFRWANFSGTEYPGIDLSYKMLQHANIGSGDFSGANFDHTSLEDAICYGCDFTNANLEQVNLERAQMQNCEFANANLKNVYIYGTDFIRAKGIKLLGPVGGTGRTIYAYTHNGEIRIQAGCFNGTPNELREAVNAKYCHKSDLHDRMDYRDAIAYLERWGNRELKRVKEMRLLDKPAAE